MDRLAILKYHMQRLNLDAAGVAARFGFEEHVGKAWVEGDQNSTPIPKVYLAELAGFSNAYEAKANNWGVEA